MAVSLSRFGTTLLPHRGHLSGTGKSTLSTLLKPSALNFIRQQNSACWARVILWKHTVPERQDPWWITFAMRPRLQDAVGSRRSPPTPARRGLDRPRRRAEHRATFPCQPPREP